MKKLYTMLFVLFPILNVYKSPIPNIEWGLFLLLIASIFVFANTRSICWTAIEWIPYLIYIGFSIIIMYWINEKNVGFSYIIFKLLKEIICYTVVIIAIKNNLILYEFAKKTYINICYLIIGLGLLQVLLYYGLHVRFYPVIGRFLDDPRYLEVFSRKDYVEGMLFRTTSVFLEPSYYYEYGFFCLIFLLFDKKAKKKIIQIIFVTVGLLTTYSGQGVLATAFIYMLWLFHKIYHNGKLNSKWILYFFVFCNVVGAYVLNSDNMKKSLERVFKLNIAGGNAIMGRGGGYIEWLKLPAFQKIFGCGYGNIVPAYYTSISFILYSMGILGALLAVYIFYTYYKKCIDYQGKVMVIMFLMFSFSSKAFMSVSALFYLFMIYGYINYKSKNIKSEKNILLPIACGRSYSDVGYKNDNIGEKKTRYIL